MLNHDAGIKLGLIEKSQISRFILRGGAAYLTIATFL
jgi:hypothetical protein